MSNPNSRKLPDFLTPAQAAGEANVSVRTLKRWIARGWLPALRLPSPQECGHLRIRAGDLAAFLATHTVD
jgi:excisionase family DNA binding protein